MKRPNKLSAYEYLAIVFVAVVTAVCLMMAAEACAEVQSDQSRWPYCRVKASDGSAGSGVLVDVNDTQALVLTNEHVIRDGGRGQVTCTFLSGETCVGQTLSIDRYRNDIAAVVVNRPRDIEPIIIDRFDGRSPVYTAVGFGAGDFRGVSGRFLGAQMQSGGSHNCATFDFTIRHGDSGGAVLDADGELVGLVWGCEQPGVSGPTYAVAGAPVHAYLERLCQCGPGGCPSWNGYCYPGQGYSSPSYSIPYQPQYVQPTQPQQPISQSPIQPPSVQEPTTKPDPPNVNYTQQFEQIFASIEKLEVSIETTQSNVVSRIEKLEAQPACQCDGTCDCCDGLKEQVAALQNTANENRTLIAALTAKQNTQQTTISNAIANMQQSLTVIQDAAQPFEVTEEVVDKIVDKLPPIRFVNPDGSPASSVDVRLGEQVTLFPK